jgi:hypothetical protein
MQKWIRFRFHHPLRIQSLGQNARQRTLADSDGPFDCNVPGEFEKIGHGLAMFSELAGYLVCVSVAIAGRVNRSD